MTSSPSAHPEHENEDQTLPVSESTQAMYRQLAIDTYQDDDVLIPCKAKVSASEYGAFVQAWVWVPAPDEA